MLHYHNFYSSPAQILECTGRFPEARSRYPNRAVTLIQQSSICKLFEVILNFNFRWSDFQLFSSPNSDMICIMLSVYALLTLRYYVVCLAGNTHNKTELETSYVSNFLEPLMDCYHIRGSFRRGGFWGFQKPLWGWAYFRTAVQPLGN